MPKGDRVVRLLKMIHIIDAHPGLSAKEIAGRCRISVRTCYRDLQALTCAEVPIYNDNGYRFLEKPRLQKISLTFDEALALLYGVKLLEKQRGPWRAGANVKEKLFELLPRQLRHEIEDLQEQVEVSANPTVDYAEKGVFFKKLNEAMNMQQSLLMEYYSFTSDELTTRMVDPYQIIYRDGFWYLAAYCHLRDEVRLFRIDRIRKLELSNKNFLKPADFDCDRYLGSAWQMERGSEYTFRVRLWGQAARYAQETRFHPSQRIWREDAGAVVFEAKACGLKSVARWILQFGGEAEVLEPVELRELVAKETGEAWGRYKKS